MDISKSNISTTDEIDKIEFSEVEDIFSLVDNFLVNNKTLLAMYVYMRFTGCNLKVAIEKIAERSNLLSSQTEL